MKRKPDKLSHYCWWITHHPIDYLADVWARTACRFGHHSNACEMWHHFTEGDAA